MQIFPKSEADKRKCSWEQENEGFDARARYNHLWNTGSIAYYHLVGENTAFPANTMKGLTKTKFESQNIVETDSCTKIETLLSVSTC